MISAVDTNIILDVLIPDEAHCASSKEVLERHLADGQLIISEIVFAELAAWFPSEKEHRSFLAETGIRLVRSSDRSLHVAGIRWAAYAGKVNKKVMSCAKCGASFEIRCPVCTEALTRRFHVLADFLIGAHALTHADCILSRDLGVYKTYFTDLKVIGSY